MIIKSSQIFGIDIKDSHVLDQSIIVGFPNNTDAMQVLNFCTIYAKYDIYIQRIFKNIAIGSICLSDVTQTGIGIRI